MIEIARDEPAPKEPYPSAFRADYLRRAATTFEAKLASRLETAKTEGRLSEQQCAAILGRPSAEQRKAA